MLLLGISKFSPFVGSCVTSLKSRLSKCLPKRGWRGGINVGITIAITVLLLNVAILAWAATRPRNADGYKSAYSGSCSTSKTLSRWIHLGINILSTLLLGASNYAMQCLMAPTRKEIEYAHSILGSWAHIGVPSLRNLGIGNSGKSVLWFFLGMSSVPLHLL
jgi:hypothetical protein